MAIAFNLEVLTFQLEQRGALFWAVARNNLEMVRMLLDAGAYPDLADKVW